MNLLPPIQHSDEKRAQLGIIELAYDTFGSPDLPPLVLISGLGNQLISWREEFCHQLALEGFFVIRFDNRDAGLSTRFDQAPTPGVFSIGSAAVWGTPLHTAYDLSDMAADVLGLLGHLGLESTHILGASLGGMIAQALAIEHPARVRSLTLMLTTPLGSRHPLPHPRSLVLFSPPAVGLEAQVERYLRVKRALRGTRYALDEADLRAQAKRLAERSPRPASTRRQLAAIAAYGNKTRALRELDIPTLVIHGTQDPLIPPGHARRLSDLIPGAKLVLVEGLGHEFPPGVWPEILPAVTSHLKHAEDRFALVRPGTGGT